MLFYVFCMSMEGIMFFRSYFSAEDLKVFEPLFLAQYLLIPVNTIVKFSLLPWMMTKHYAPARRNANPDTKTEKTKAREVKAEIFLRYELLKQLMEVVKKHGRDKEYNFDKDTKLAKIRDGIFESEAQLDRIKNMLGIDSFMTIWLITLPAKFVNWWKYQKSETEKNSEEQKILSFKEVPDFNFSISQITLVLRRMKHRVVIIHSLPVGIFYPTAGI